MKLGLNAKLYGGPANNDAPTTAYVAVTGGVMLNVQDLAYNDERDEIDISTRGSQFNLTATSMRKVSLSFSMIADEGNAEYADVQTNYVGNIPMSFTCLSSVGGKGVKGDWIISKCNVKQGLKDALIADVEIKPTYQSVGAGTARYPAAV